MLCTVSCNCFFLILNSLTLSPQSFTFHHLLSYKPFPQILVPPLPYTALPLHLIPLLFALFTSLFFTSLHSILDKFSLHFWLFTSLLTFHFTYPLKCLLSKNNLVELNHTKKHGVGRIFQQEDLQNNLVTPPEILKPAPMQTQRKLLTTQPATYHLSNPYQPHSAVYNYSTNQITC